MVHRTVDLTTYRTRFFTACLKESNLGVPQVVSPNKKESSILVFRTGALCIEHLAASVRRYHGSTKTFVHRSWLVKLIVCHVMGSGDPCPFCLKSPNTHKRSPHRDFEF